MNTLGRLFIVLIFVASIMLMSFSVVLLSTHTNWRVRAETFQAQLNAKTAELAALQKTKADMESALKIEINRRGDRIVALTESLEQLTIDNQEAVDRLADAEAERLQAQTLAQTAQDNMVALRTRLDETAEKLLTAQRDWANMSTELLQKTDEAHGLAIRLTNYQSRALQLAEDYRNVIEVLRIHGLPADPQLFASTPPAGVHGSVTEVRPGGNVELSIGADSGLAKGHTLDVIRERNGRSTYIGKVEITNTVADRATARILPEFRRGVVQLGDEVLHIEVNELSAR